MKPVLALTVDWRTGPMTMEGRTVSRVKPGITVFGLGLGLGLVLGAECAA